MGRRYDRANLDDTIRAAREKATRDNQTMYVGATAYGYLISLTRPPFNASYYTVTPEQITCHQYDWNTEDWTIS